MQTMVRKDGQVVGGLVAARWNGEFFAFTSRNYETLAWVVADRRNAKQLEAELEVVLEALRRWKAEAGATGRPPLTEARKE